MKWARVLDTNAEETNDIKQKFIDRANIDNTKFIGEAARFARMFNGLT